MDELLRARQLAEQIKARAAAIAAHLAAVQTGMASIQQVEDAARKHQVRLWVWVAAGVCVQWQAIALQATGDSKSPNPQNWTELFGARTLPQLSLKMW
jgi:hypothetical protein